MSLHSNTCDNLSNFVATACHGLQVFHFPFVVRSLVLLIKLSKIANPCLPFWASISSNLLGTQHDINQSSVLYEKRFSIAERHLIRGIMLTKALDVLKDQWSGKDAAVSHVLYQALENWEDVEPRILWDCSTETHDLGSTWRDWVKYVHLLRPT